MEWSIMQKKQSQITVIDNQTEDDDKPLRTWKLIVKDGQIIDMQEVKE